MADPALPYTAAEADRSITGPQMDYIRSMIEENGIGRPGWSVFRKLSVKGASRLITALMRNELESIKVVYEVSEEQAAVNRRLRGEAQ